MRLRSTIALLAFAVAACGGKRGSGPPRPPPPMTAERLDDLASLAIGSPLDPGRRQTVLAQLRSGALSIDRFADELVHDPQFSREIAPHLLLGYLETGPYSFVIFTLIKDQIDGQTVYFQSRAGGARTKCTLAQTVEVAPWWDLTTKVRVCPADYQPTALRTKDGSSCSGITGGGATTFECGCGPNLINCTPDPEAMQKSFLQETIGTIAHVVEHDLPLATVATTNYSFRDRNVAYAYERDHVYQGKIAHVPDLSSWPVEGKWAPRDEDWPGAHAGILTNRQFLWMTDGPRDRMRLYYERFWCKVPTSFGVDVDVFRKLVHGVADLRNRGARWQQLAAQPGCTECHARMDYGMQFFAGYPSAFIAVTGTPETSRHSEVGALYADNIHDERGKGTLTPHRFAELLVSQPEFGDCMVDHVERHVLGVATDDERAELRATFERTGQLRPLFATALRQYAARPVAPEPAPPVVKLAGRDTRDGRRALPDRLVAMLDDHCAECHGDRGDPIGFLADLDRTRALDRGRLMTMANVIASGLMPKNRPMAPADRRAVLVELAELLAPDAAWARDALGYWTGRDFMPSRIHHIRALRNRMLAGVPAGAKDETNVRALVDFSLERELLVATPGAVMEMAKLAASACAHVAPDQRLACYVEALRPEVAKAE